MNHRALTGANAKRALDMARGGASQNEIARTLRVSRGAVRTCLEGILVQPGRPASPRGPKRPAPRAALSPIASPRAELVPEAPRAEPSIFDDPAVALGVALGRAMVLREIAAYLEEPNAEPITSAAAPELRGLAELALAPVRVA